MLSILSSIYGKVTDIRNTFYDKGLLRTFDLGARTISIGNITVGGTGKTPLVKFVAEALAANGERVCILTRGYGRENPKNQVLVSDGNELLADPRSAGDEPFELAQGLLGKAIVIADADRVAAAKLALSKFGVTTFLLDDGYQHRKVKRSLDIVCIDATDAFAGNKMLPVGRLREKLSNIDRADAVVITRADLVEDISDTRSAVLAQDPEAEIFTSSTSITRITPLEDFLLVGSKTLAKRNEAGRSDPSQLAVFAFCGLGNPTSFVEQLRRASIAVVGNRTFKDHHRYSRQDIAEIEKRAREHNAAMLMTTAKDAVKLGDLRFEIPCCVVEIALTIDRSEAFSRLILSSA